MRDGKCKTAPNLWLCLLVALGVRLAFLFIGFPILEKTLVLNYDADGYGRIADQILAGQYHDAERAPLYPVFVAIVFEICSHSLTAVKLAQVLLDTTTVALIWATGFRATSNRHVGAWAGWLYAVYPLAWWRCGFINKEILEVFALVLFVWFLFRAIACLRQMDGHSSSSLQGRQALHTAGGQASLPVRGARPPREWRCHTTTWLTPWFLFFCGLLLGVVNLVKPIFLLLPVMLAVWFWREQARLRSAAVWLAVLVLGMLLVITPWTVRNLRLTGRIVPVALERGGLTCYVGNYYPTRGAWEGENRHQWENELQRIANEHPTADAVQLDRIYYRAAFRNITAHPPQFAEMFVRKAWRFWFSNASGRLGTVVLVVQILFVGLGLAGVFRSRLDWSTRILLCLVVGYVCLIHAIAYADVRFSLPVMPLVMLLGAGAVSKGNDGG